MNALYSVTFVVIPTFRHVGLVVLVIRSYNHQFIEMVRVQTIEVRFRSL